MKIAYVHGFLGKAGGRSFTNLQKNFPEHEFYSESYDLLNIKETQERVNSIKADVIIGNSLGGFYVLNSRKTCCKIVVNPCIYPSKVIPSLAPKDNPLGQKYIDEFSKIEENLFSDYDMEDRITTFGVFGDSDTTCPFIKDFKKNVPACIFDITNNVTVKGPHKLEEDEIVKGVLCGFNYFNILDEYLYFLDYLVPGLGFDDELLQEKGIDVKQFYTRLENYKKMAQDEKVRRQELGLL